MSSDRAMGNSQRAILEALLGCPIFDHHAHNLVGPASDFPYEKCFTEADGEALTDVHFTLSFRRSKRDLAELFGCEPSYEAILKARQALGLDELTSRCFRAAHIGDLLLDDGLRLDQMHDCSWHSKYVPVVKRVLRIERVAEDILNDPKFGSSGWTLEAFDRCFRLALDPLPEGVVAFKSIVAYRTGLDIDPHISKQAAEEGLEATVNGHDEDEPIRLQDKRLLDFIFLRGLEAATQFGIPMQLHTAFGDRDLDLRLANPLYLKKVLEDQRFRTSRLVLLHSYPYAKEAGHLASIYSQVYIDFGLAVPKLSVRGMLATVSDLLNLAPANKVLFSTDGYAAPETYFLGAKWGREVLARVLSQAVEDKDLTQEEATTIGLAILRDNARALYDPSAAASSLSQQDPEPLILEDTPETSSLGGAKLVRLLWCDNGGQRRCKVVPVERYSSTIVAHGTGLTQACMAMPSFTDGPAPGANLSAVGEIRLVPDMKTHQVLPWCPEHAVVMVDMHIVPGKAWEVCPRSTLKRVAAKLKEEFGLVMRVGIESEFYLLKANSQQSSEDQNWVGSDLTPYCSTQALDTRAALLKQMTDVLSTLGIEIEQLHPESGPGQFEIAVGHKPAEEAADDVLLLRETVTAVAAKDNLQATFMPKYFPTQSGTGSHLHMSLWRGTENVLSGGADVSNGQHGMSEIGCYFLAGLLHHLPALLTLTATHPNSYARIQPNTWSGAYQCWGFDNREAPLRTASPPGQLAGVVNNVELKAIDALANPHIALAGIIVAGMDGLRQRMPLPDPVEVNPADVEGVQRLPSSLPEALACLEKDTVLQEGLGSKLATAIKAVRKAEVEFCETTPASVVAELLVGRY